jgi:hypothetical protein
MTGGAELLPAWLAFAQEASFPALSVAAIVWAVSQFIRVLPTLKQHQITSDSSLRADLLERVADLEAEVKSLRKALDTERIRCAAEVLDLQHDLANESGSLDALILLIEANPENVLEQVPKIKQMREEHRRRMAIKRGTREATLIAQTATAEDADLAARAADTEAA